VSERYLHAIREGGRPELFDKGLMGQRILGHLAPAVPRHNSYHWDWVMPDGDFFKSGFGGQGLFISPERDLVIAFFGTMDAPHGENALPSIAQQLSAGWQA